MTRLISASLDIQTVYAVRRRRRSAAATGAAAVYNATSVVVLRDLKVAGSGGIASDAALTP